MLLPDFQYFFTNSILSTKKLNFAVFDQPYLSFLLGKGRNKIILIISFLFSIFLVFYFLNPSSTASFLFLNWTHFIDIKANSAHNKQSKNSSIHSYELF